jgi:hypothetical protein
MERHFVRPLRYVFPSRSPSPRSAILRLVSGCASNHAFPTFFATRIFQNNGTAPHPNPIHFTLIGQLYPPVQYVYSLGSSHRQALG